jgi:hypothetical protein
VISAALTGNNKFLQKELDDFQEAAEKSKNSRYRLVK